MSPIGFLEILNVNRILKLITQVDQMHSMSVWDQLMLIHPFPYPCIRKVYPHIFQFASISNADFPRHKQTVNAGNSKNMGQHPRHLHTLNTANSKKK